MPQIVYDDYYATADVIIDGSEYEDVDVRVDIDVEVSCDHFSHSEALEIVDFHFGDADDIETLLLNLPQSELKKAVRRIPELNTVIDKYGDA